MRKTTALLFTLLLATAAFAQDPAKPHGKLTKVEPKTVCMITERAMGREQIPVEVEGRTYYGCCEMCKNTLANNAEKRSATDPVSGKKIDKATAVIAAQEDGQIFYFESDATLAKHNKQFEK